MRTECGDTHPKVHLLFGTQEMITGALVPSSRQEKSVGRPVVWPALPAAQPHGEGRMCIAIEPSWLVFEIACASRLTGTS